MPFVFLRRTIRRPLAFCMELRASPREFASVDIGGVGSVAMQTQSRLAPEPTGSVGTGAGQAFVARTVGLLPPTHFPIVRGSAINGPGQSAGDTRNFMQIIEFELIDR